MTLKEIRKRKDRLAVDVITLIERFKEDTGGFQITDLHFHTAHVAEIGSSEILHMPENITIKVEEV